MKTAIKILMVCCLTFVGGFCTCLIVMHKVEVRIIQPDTPVKIPQAPPSVKMELRETGI